jgi:hypothetical protein
MENQSNQPNGVHPQGTPNVYPPAPGTPVYPVQGVAPVQQVNHGYTAQTPVYPQQAAGYVPVQPVNVVDSSKKLPDRKSVATKMIELVYLFLIILESVLALRFIFKLLGANPENVFIQFLYNATLVFTYPFAGLFGMSVQNSIAVSRYNLEFTTLVAMGVYALLAYIIVRIIDVFR